MSLGIEKNRIKISKKIGSLLALKGHNMLRSEIELDIVRNTPCSWDWLPWIWQLWAGYLDPRQMFCIYIDNLSIDYKKIFLIVVHNIINKMLVCIFWKCNYWHLLIKSLHLEIIFKTSKLDILIWKYCFFDVNWLVNEGLRFIIVLLYSKLKL